MEVKIIRASSGFAIEVDAVSFFNKHPNINIIHLSTTCNENQYLMTIVYTDNNITNTDKL